MFSNSDHLNKRIRERVHIPKKSTTSFIKKAIENGIYLEDISSSKLRQYMKQTIRGGYYGIIYGRYLVILTKYSNRGVTILNIPKDLHKLLDEEKIKQKGKKDNDNSINKKDSRTSNHK